MKPIVNSVMIAVALMVSLGYLYRSGQSVQIAANPGAALPSSVAIGAKPAVKLEKAAPLMFGGYPCGDDCLQHNAGYRWGRDNGINEPDNCDGLTAPFIEGCRVYAEQRRMELRPSS
jgi:hypothetical protein